MRASLVLRAPIQGIIHRAGFGKAIPPTTEDNLKPDQSICAFHRGETQQPNLVYDMSPVVISPGETPRPHATSVSGSALAVKAVLHHHQSLGGLPDRALDRIWAGDAAGMITFPGRPTFEDKLEEREWIKAHLAGAFRFWAKRGFSEGLAGHISVRDPILRDHFWM
jgi:hypothetical protein